MLTKLKEIPVDSKEHIVDNVSNRIPSRDSLQVDIEMFLG